jgi:hypothetical protein
MAAARARHLALPGAGLMAQLALTLIGGGVGLAFGAPQIGAAIGSIAGAELQALMTPSASKKNVPTPADKRVQAATYGVVIPQIAGTMRLAGNIIWSVPIYAVATDVTTGGGGGGAAGSGAGSTTIQHFVYYSSFAVSWGENLLGGPFTTILRIWADGKLIWDNRPRSKGGVRRTGTTSLHHYYGSDTQLPSPIIQNRLGADFTPAYRGQAYSVFHTMDLTRFGNRIPNFTAELATSADASHPLVKMAQPFSVQRWIVDSLNDVIYGYQMGSFFKYSMVTNDLLASTGEIVDGSLVGDACLGDDGFIYQAGGGGGNAQISKIDPSTMSVVDTTADTVHMPDRMRCVGGGYVTGVAFSTFLQAIWVLCETSIESGVSVPTMRIVGQINETHSCAIIDPASIVNTGSTVVFDLWAVDLTAGEAFLYRYQVIDRLGSLLGSSITLVETIDLFTTFGVANIDMCYLAEEHALIIGGTSGILKYSLDTRTITGAMTGGSLGNFNFDQGPVGGIIVANFGNYATVFDVREWAIISQPVYASYDPGATIPLVTVFSPLAYDGNSNAIWLEYALVLQLLLDREAPNEVAVADIAAAIMEKGGLTSGQIDTSDVPDTTHGYMLTRQAPARAGLLPLSTGYFFDVVESDFKMKLVKRGHAPAATLTKDEIGAYAAGSKRPDAFLPVRMPEQELPRRISVKYLNYGALYQDGLQSEQRIIVGTDMQAVGEQSVDLGIALSDDEAKAIANRLLYLTWTKRDSATSSYSRKWLLLDPADVIALQKDGKTYTLRLTQTDLGLNGVINFASEFENPDIYTSLPIGVGGSGVPPEPGTGDIISPIVAFFLDIVMLRDADDDDGFYWGVAPLDEDLAFLGGSSFKSVDDGSTYNPWETSTQAMTAGSAVNALGSAPGGRWTTWDRVNTLTVRMFSGSVNMVSAPSELAVLNGANSALLGDEVIGFLNATDNGDGTFTLDTLIRARRGSDGNGLTHAAGDRFILLSATNAGIVDLVGGDLNLTRQYKSVALGDNSLPAVFTTFTDTANRLRPYAVMAIKGTRSGGDLTLTWIRRSRLTGTWNIVTSSALGEASEAYEVDIMNGSTVVRTIAGLSAQTASYTSAQQTADFGSPQASISVKVYQLNATVGRGFASAATV